jgi:DNA-binding GntR family transcriptional regulator
VSSTPIVQALRRLEHDGLVTGVPKWGATVKEWTWGEVVEAFYIRRGLEGQAAELFVMRATPADKEKLGELMNLLDGCATADPVDPMRFAEADVDLHLHIARSTGFPRLYQLVENSNVERSAIFGFLVKAHGELLEDYRTNVNIHQALVNSLQGTDPTAARNELWRHMDIALELIAKFRARNG